MVDRSHLGRRGLVAGIGLAGATLAAGGRPAFAIDAALPAPKGPAILTVSGKIAVHNLGAEAVFDMAMLNALPQAGFATTNPWTSKTTFTGVLLSTLLRRLGATGTIAYAYALDDYLVEIPLTKLSSDGPLLSTEMNGQYMPVAHYGPIFVMYDFAKHREWLRNDIYARCIWHLDRIVIA